MEKQKENVKITKMDEPSLEELYPEFYEDPAYIKAQALKLINQSDADKLRGDREESDSGEQ